MSFNYLRIKLEFMFSCQVKDVFDQPSVYVPFYMWRIHNFHAICELLCSVVQCSIETSYPLYMGRKSSYARFRITVHSQILNTACTVKIILSKLHTNYRS